ncbi:MAG: mycofactocin biosynthesis glycosyltransferase MftF, partial [Actinomycetales bacterium]
VRHRVNQGPGAARNSGIEQGSGEFIAFVDADCVVDRDWPHSLLHHFRDPAVAAAAPRVLPLSCDGSLLGRYEQARSSLDMGPRPELVRPGARLGFVPSAALVVRRSIIESSGFDPSLRLGEDVDLVWRLADAGWLVRYDPSVIVRHRSRTRLRSWLHRKAQYGSSAAALQARHPGRLAPARVSLTSLSTLGLVAIGKPLATTIPVGVGYLTLARHLEAVPKGRALAARTIGFGLVADAQSIGRALRREWWPLGALALMASPRSRVARAATATMIVPLVAEWAQSRPPIDPMRYLGMRLIDDAAYGTGVIASSIAARTWRTLMPVVSLPRGRAATTSRPSRTWP